MPDLALPPIRRALAEEKIDGWLFYYFQGNDPLALRLLKIPAGRFFTRRWFYFIPRQGAPVRLVHKIEPDALDGLPGRRFFYSSWIELRKELGRLLRGARRVAMQYSPKNAVPYISRVDAGTVELVRSLGVHVASSGDLVQRFEAVLSPVQWRDHQKTAKKLRETVLDAFRFTALRIRAGRKTTERDIQKFILSRFARQGLATGSDPIVAVNGNSSRPHYVPTDRRNAAVKKGDWLLLDIWAKPKTPGAVYADITWCGYVGETVPARYEKIFQIVRSARDKAADLVAERFRQGKTLQGWGVDRAARQEIERAGYGKYFIHRTGHSIGVEDHGNGANMDGLETHETRRLLPGTLFSIEPGIYLKDFGARSEINVYIDGNRTVVSGLPIQDCVIPILKTIPL